MSRFKRALAWLGFGPQALGENATTTNLTAEELLRVLGAAGRTASGQSVTAESAMRVSAVYGCVSLIAGAIASLPIGIYERTEDTRRKVQHDYWWMLNEQAADDWTSFDAWQYLIAAKLFEGDGFAELIRSSFRSSKVIGWKPHHPGSVQPFVAPDGALMYRITEGGSRRIVHAADMLHLRSLGFDGLRSPSPITYAAREAIGTALAAEAYSAKFFADGATFDYALKTAARVSKDQLEQLKASLLARTDGGRAPLILTGGLEPAQLSVNPKDAEILSTRLFTVEEICRIFGVPPHMVGHTDKTTSWGSGIEQQGIAFVRYTLMRHLVPIAQELNRKLWPLRERYFVEHVTAALERGDLKARNEAYRVAAGRAGEPGWMTVNEIRRIENMPPIDGGDEINRGESDAPQPTAATAD